MRLAGAEEWDKESKEMAGKGWERKDNKEVSTQGGEGYSDPSEERLASCSSPSPRAPQQLCS